jgi:hypothetical protein
MQNASRLFAFIDRRLRVASLSLIIFTFICIGVSWPSAAQEAVQGTEGQTVAGAPVVPQQVRYSGKLVTRAGETVEAVFRIYATAEGGEPLWTETQRIGVAVDGFYSVLLGAASPAGLPQTVFAGGAARWLGVSVERAEELERAPLSSVPYAMKSADAESLGGHAATEFVTQAQLAALVAQLAALTAKTRQTPETQPDTSGTVTGSGTAGTVPLWTGANTQGNSEIVQVGSDIGINQATPAATLDIGGTENVNGVLSLPPLGTATPTFPQRSQLVQFSASAWSTKTNAPVTPTFKLLTNFVNNNTANASGQLELHFQQGTESLSVLSIGGNGVINFAPSQTFPGTINSVIGTSPVTATTTSGAVSLGLNTSALQTSLNSFYAQLGATNTFTQPISFAAGQTFPGTIGGVTAGTGLTGGGTSGAPTLSVDSTQVPLLSKFNNFAGGLQVENTFEVLGIAGAVNSGLANFGSSGATDSNSTIIFNGTGSDETFVSGCNGCFVPGAQAGDGGMRVKPAQNIFFGDSAKSRLELDSAGNALQPGTAGGMVKAMLFYSPSNGGKVEHCFNSILSGAAATTPPCGISIINNFIGDYVLDFGFRIDDRFLMSQVYWDSGVSLAICMDIGETCNNPDSLNANRVEVTIQPIGGGPDTNDEFYLIVY